MFGVRKDINRYLIRKQMIQQLLATEKKANLNDHVWNPCSKNSPETTPLTTTKFGF